MRIQNTLMALANFSEWPAAVFFCHFLAVVKLWSICVYGFFFLLRRPLLRNINRTICQNMVETDVVEEAESWAPRENLKMKICWLFTNGRQKVLRFGTHILHKPFSLNFEFDFGAGEHKMALRMLCTHTKCRFLWHFYSNNQYPTVQPTNNKCNQPLEMIALMLYAWQRVQCAWSSLSLSWNVDDAKCVSLLPLPLLLQLTFSIFFLECVKTTPTSNRPTDTHTCARVRPNRN